MGIKVLGIDLSKNLFQLHFEPSAVTKDGANTLDALD